MQLKKKHRANRNGVEAAFKTRHAMLSFSFQIINLVKMTAIMMIKKPTEGKEVV